MGTRKTHDHFFRVEKGGGEVVIDGTTHKLKSGDAILVPAGASHNLINVDPKDLKVYTIYGMSARRTGGGRELPDASRSFVGSNPLICFPSCRPG